MELRIFQRGFNFSQDGPGNRLVYHLQGCNLRCPWCSNPEGLAAVGGQVCPIDELVDEVERSKLMFFDGGGVTLTGGEVTMQLAAVKDFLTQLHSRGINTCIETNGLHPQLCELFPVLDHLIMDIKHWNSETHRAVTGLSNDLTIQNIEKALAANQPLALRIPLIGGFNASKEDAAGFAALFDRLGVRGRASIELLPYHEFGRDKYNKLGLTYEMDETAKITKETLAAFSGILLDAGYPLIHT